MRLTLRTLLAFLDGILEPGDAQDLGKKVEESEFATSLVHRIRDVMRRLRLGAPSLTDRGPGLDANTVAEYLDNTLPADRVADFEKVCLESDVHLAEVASCHQILTLVLGEPAEVNPTGRQRMYQIQHLVDELQSSEVSAGSSVTPPLPSASGAPATPVAAESPIAPATDDWADRRARMKPAVPEYLREPHGRRRVLPIVAALVLAACFAVVVLNSLGQFEPETPLGNAMVRLGIVAVRPEVAAGESAAPNGEPPVKPAKPKTPGGTDAGEKTPETNISPTKPATEEPIKPSPTEPAAGAPTGKVPVTEPGKEPAEGATPKPEKPIEPAKPGAVAPPATEPGPKPPVEPGIEPKPEPGKPAAKPAEPAPLPPEPLGRFTSIDQVLLRDAPGGWMRAAPNQVLTPQRLLVLPTYRAKVSLTAGVAAEILGGSQIELLGSGLQELPGVRVVYGRLVLMPLAKAGARLRIVLGDRTGMLTFVDAESMAALEVRQIHATGMNPETEPPRVVAELYATSGNLLWEESGAKEPVQLSPPSRLSFDGALTSAPAVAKELPKWITAEPIGALDHRASNTLGQSLQTDRPARLGLLELSDHRQREVRWLALRSLAYIGHFQAMVAALNDQAHKSDWPDYIEQLREAAARDPESAAAVRQAFEKQYPQQADELYRMLWGYTDKDLAGGEDAKLTKALEDENLPVRVLAYWNLKDITGLGLFYRPEQTLAKRQQPITRWRLRLEAKEIRNKSAEEKAGAAAGEGAVAPPPTEPGQ